METTKLLGKKIKDTKQDYQGDVGEVADIRHFQKANKTYAVVKWGENSKHGDGEFRNYSPDKFGMFKRFRIVE